MLKNKKKILIITITAIIISLTAYLAADRYLIRHVEIANVKAYSSAVEYNSSSGAVESETSQEQGNTGSSQESSAIEPVTMDDWNYKSSTVTISIKEYTTGSGNDSLAYFVADVVLDDATRLKNAFADAQFGRNIIAGTSDIAEENDAIFAINGDYYGFRSNGIVIRNGVLYRDEPALDRPCLLS